MAIKDWVDEFYLEKARITSLKKTFISQHPFPYLELKNFLNEDKAGKLLLSLIKEPFLPKKSDLFSFKQTQDLIGTKNEHLTSFRKFLCSKEFISYMTSLTGIPLKAGKVDLFGSLYEGTDHLLCHDDELDERRIAFLFYLSNFQEQDGGALTLFDKQFNSKATIIPQFNTFSFFEVSKHSFHEVGEVIGQKQRLALGGWFHDP